ncbi:MAG: hypothetical protein P4M07_13155 [Xanthobacteraceae bacterium]|nr:hypothetical protein [Xanthobacteraceae bacterium]
MAVVAMQWTGLRPAADDPTLLSWAAAGQQAQPDWSPLYVLLLRGAYLLCGDTLDAFRVAVAVISLSGCAMVYGWILQCTANVRLAAFAAIFYLTSGFSPAASTTEQSHLLIVSSVAGHFALCFVLIALICLGRLARPTGLALCSTFLLLATYCRPEFLLASGVCLLASCVVTFRTRPPGAGVAYLLMAAVIWIALASYWGLPVPSPGRGFVAFSQHAGLGFCAVYDAFCPTNLWENHAAYAAKLFPGATSISTALMRDPLPFMEHVGRNIAISSVNLVTGVVDFAGLLNIPTMFKAAFGAAMLVWLGLICFRTEPLRGDAQCHPKGKSDRTPLIVAAFAIAPQFANWLLLYPRLHYMVVPVAVSAGLVLARRRIVAQPAGAAAAH